MSTSSQTIRARCACGCTEHEASGSPVVALACYCDDCQAAGAQIDALPQGHSGLSADGGTVSMLFRKDRVRCVRGGELLVPHKLRSEAYTTRIVASCCNSNVLTRFENWLPIVAVRNFSADARVEPQVSIYTRFAPDATLIRHAGPRYQGMPPSIGLKVVASAVGLGFRRLFMADDPTA
jgi:hypothetical protein